jgi:adenosine kinase
MYGIDRGMDWATTGRVAALMGAIKIEKHGTQNHGFEADEFSDRFKQNFGYTL